MVVVMPLGHSIQSFWTGPAQQIPDPVMKAMAGATLSEIINAMMGGDGKGGLSPVTRDIVEDVLPMVETPTSVSKRPDDRAIAGLSMGGGHTINIVFCRPELFRYAVMMSPAAGGGIATMYPKIGQSPDTSTNSSSCSGSASAKTTVSQAPATRRSFEALTKIGVKRTFVVSPRPPRMDRVAAPSGAGGAAAVPVRSDRGNSRDRELTAPDREVSWARAASTAQCCTRSMPAANESSQPLVIARTLRTFRTRSTRAWNPRPRRIVQQMRCRAVGRQPCDRLPGAEGNDTERQSPLPPPRRRERMARTATGSLAAVNQRPPH